jgi:hypothetical protein
MMKASKSDAEKENKPMEIRQETLNYDKKKGRRK